MSFDHFKNNCAKGGDYDSFVIKATRRVSPYLSYALYKFGLTANMVTVLGMVVGTIGAILLTRSEMFPVIVGLVMLHVSNVLDYCDGEIARYTKLMNNDTRVGIAGAYLDWLWHLYIPIITIFCLSFGVFKQSGHINILFFGFIALIGFCIFPFSCKEHILIATIRRYPNIISDTAVRDAMKDSLVSIHGDMTPRNRIYSIIRKQLADMTYYPSFFNVLTVVVGVDLVLGDYKIRYWYIILLMVLVSFHQVLKIVRTYYVLDKIQIQ
ncbi:CDP-alcohol phosphatidyltransferase family protein [Geobacter sulfurreducens]|uniref:CDP-alcohol phosphatidyltransferase family protein n=1 Tax=Geobacter sulfurreducens TaxID=35554 RepID=UPI002C77E06F|nr:CDP-alcohol phosphatidyltransferase family protein [Geobacter sulfurreducens]HML78125.1 CDP-alcohol phosphatidyltransferase family protein [Geobacter sulfurreducens]